MRRIDYTLITSLGILAIALIMPGSIGPCGPTSNLAAIKLIIIPTAFFGIILGAALSLGSRIKNGGKKQKPEDRVNLVENEKRIN